MILEVAIFAVKLDAIAEFEAAYKQASPLIGRAKGKRFVALAGAERIVFDADPAQAHDEPGHLSRKGSRDDE